MTSAIIEQFLDSCERHPNRIAVKVGTTQGITFAHLKHEALGFAAGLEKAGIAPGSTIALVLANGLPYVTSFFGGLLHGVVVASLDPRWRTTDLGSALADTRPRLIVAERSFFPNRLAKVLRSTLPDSLSADDVYFTESEEWGGTYEQLIGTGPARVDVPSSTTAAVFYTSGSAGVPRAVKHSHSELDAAATSLKRLHAEFFSGGSKLHRISTLVRQYRTRLLRPAIGKQIWFTPMAFHGIAGNSLMLQALCTGQTITTLRHFDPVAVLKLIDEARVTTVAVSPRMAELILSAAQRIEPRPKLSSVLVVGIGGGSVDPQVAADLRKLFGSAIAIGYGSTELAGGVLATNILDPVEIQLSTVGRPFPGVEIRIVDETGEAAKVGIIGELICKADHLDAMANGRGYLVDSDGWYHTGDLAKISHDGFVQIVGRKDELIVRNGQNLFPQEVESVAQRCQGVARAALTVIERETKSVLVLVVTPSQSLPELQRLRNTLRSELAAYKQPDEILCMESIPESADGKIRYGMIREKIRDAEKPDGNWETEQGRRDSK